MTRIITELSEEDQKANHVPEDIWKLSREHEVYVRDKKTGELVQIIDVTEDDTREGAKTLWLRNQKKKS
jgi:hypothetical protein